jgi:signal transduction histidine kinase
MVNPYVTEICNKTEAEILERPLAEICPELHENISTQKSDDELAAHFFDNQVVIGYILTDLTDSEGTIDGYILSFKDLTEIIKIRKTLRQKERLSAMGEVVARVAHEMRNPLFGMTAAAQILEMELSLNAGQQELMNSLLNESRRLNRLVEELLQTTRETVINKKRINLITTLNDSLQIISPLFSDKGVSLRKDYPDEAVWVSADAERLLQVLINLSRNALEASSVGGSVSVAVATADSWVSVIVTDTGEGIPVEKLDTVFDVFYTTRKNGTGIGLSISRNIMEAHGGNLTADNNPDGGARFVMQLPIGEGPA